MCPFVIPGLGRASCRGHTSGFPEANGVVGQGLTGQDVRWDDYASLSRSGGARAGRAAGTPEHQSRTPGASGQPIESPTRGRTALAHAPVSQRCWCPQGRLTSVGARLRRATPPAAGPPPRGTSRSARARSAARRSPRDRAACTRPTAGPPRRRRRVACQEAVRPDFKGDPRPTAPDGQRKWQILRTERAARSAVGAY